MTERARPNGVADHLLLANTPWAVGARLLLLALASLVLVYGRDPALHSGFHAGLLWRNALPVFLLLLLLYGFSGRTLLSILLGTGVTWLVFSVNAIKELNMGEPLMPGDLVLVHQVLHNIGFFAHYTGHRRVLLLLAMLVFAGLLWLVWKLEKRWFRLRWMPRLGLVALSLVMLITLYRGNGFWQEAYANEGLVGYQPWAPLEAVEKVGFMAGLVRMTQDYQITLPKADKALVAHFAESHADDVQARMERKLPAELPDIVVVQSEAFFDPGVLKGVNFGEFTPNFERLAATGITGSLTTPTYGGGTIRTEFETLTGYPMQAFQSVVYPYYGLVRPWMPSVPRRLQAFGYSTTLFHPFLGSFWNRDQVMPQLGFEHLHFVQDFGDAQHAGAYVSDHALFDYVLAHLDANSHQPQYAMVITMENHGPWNNDPGALARVLDGHPLPSGLSPAGTGELTYYLSHLVNGDQALGDFAKQLLARPHWTVLVFYGDHLPALPHAFSDLGFDDGKGDTEEHTRYLLVSNRPLVPRHADLSSYDLPGLLFDVTGLPEDGYLALASTIRQAWAQDHYEHGPHFGQIQFNAAILEVNCGHKLSKTGKCKRHLLPVADSISSHAH